MPLIASWIVLLGLSLSLAFPAIFATCHTGESPAGLTPDGAREPKAGAVSAPTGSVETDREALVALYNATDGPNWEMGLNWMSNLPLELWGGVRTDDNGRVVGLNLLGPGPTGRGLRGEIPPEFGNLAALQWLSLAQNRFSGGLPPEMGKLANLQYLDLRDSNLSGEIPSELGSLSSLERLDLSHNRLTGPIPPELSNLSGLERLSLEWNQLSGEIPDELWNMTNTYLALSPNQDDWCVPSTQLDRWEQYESVNLPECASPGLWTPTPAPTRGPRPTATATPYPTLSPAAVGDREALVALYNATGGDSWHYSENWLSDAPLSQWAGVATDDTGRVTSLELPYTNLSGDIPLELGSLANLQLLILPGNQLSGGMVGLGSLSSLQGLYLNGNRLSGEIPPELGGLSNLQWLDLSQNQLSGEIPSELGSLANLTGLDLYWNNLRGDIPPEFGSLFNLSYLDLSRNQLSGEIPSELGDLSNLKELRIDGSWTLRGCVPAELQSHLDMERSDLQDVPFCGAAPTPAPAGSPEDRAALVALYTTTDGPNWANNDNWLSDAPLNQWHGVTTDERGRVVSLLLSLNNLNGELPPELGSLSRLRELSLSGNRLRGEIPAELGKLSNLIALFIDSNQLSGCIPGSLEGQLIMAVSNLGDLPFC